MINISSSIRESTPTGDAGRFEPTSLLRGGLSLVLFLLLALPLHSSSPQTPDTTSSIVSTPADTTSIIPWRAAVLGGATAGGFVVGHVVLGNLWWKGEQAPFRFEWDRDWDYALGADKAGHAITPYIGVDLYRQGVEWAGFSRRDALWVAAGLAWGYTTYVEIRDGFSAEWGFSWGDMIANALGIGYRVAEEYVPELEAVTFKLSYWPSEAYEAGLYGSIVDDYESTYHWASFDPEIFLPSSVDEVWPDWLNIGLAHSVEGVAAYDGSGSHRFTLALDIDTEGFGVTDPFFSTLLRILNYYHLPMPSWTIGHGVGLR